MPMKHYSIYSLGQLEVPPVLEVHSTEGDIYTADCILQNGERALICRDDGNPLSSHSLAELHAQLDGIAFEEARLIQHSAYDEMIGTPTHSGKTSMVLHWGSEVA